MVKKKFIISVTGAAGNLGSSLMFLLAKEKIFRNITDLTLRMVDLPLMIKKLEGIKMELEDCNFPILKNIEIFEDCEQAFINADCIILAGAKPRGPGMKRKDLLEKNVMLFKKQAEMINNVYDDNMRILVVGNPCNTLSIIFSHFAQKVPKDKITFLSYLDQNRAVSMIQKKVKVPSSKIKNVVVIGNHSSTMFIDTSHGYFVQNNRENNDHSRIMLSEILDKKFIEEELQEEVKKRGGLIIEKKIKSASFSASNAIITHLKKWYEGSNEEIISLGIFCKEIFGFKNLFVSMPVICKNGQYTKAKDYFAKFSKENLSLIKKSLGELKFEKNLAFHILLQSN